MPALCQCFALTASSALPLHLGSCRHQSPPMKKAPKGGRIRQLFGQISARLPKKQHSSLVFIVLREPQHSAHDRSRQWLRLFAILRLTN